MGSEFLLFSLFSRHTYIHTYIHTYTRWHAPTHAHTCTHTYIHTYIHTHTHIHTYIYTYIHVSVPEWLAWLTSNFGRIGAIGSIPSNGLKGFNPLCHCVYIYVCIVNPDIQTIHRCSHTSIHTYTHTYTHTYIHTCIHTLTAYAKNVFSRFVSEILKTSKIRCGVP